MKLVLALLFSQLAFCKPLKVTHVQDMNFGSLVQGDGKKKIRRAKSEPNNARFNVSGDKNTSYTIILPESFTISRDGSGGFPLTISSLRSRPSAGANGNLGRNGKQTIYIGATLQRIRNKHPAGSYSGSFLIEVLY